ncbi:SNF2- related helicase [Bifidobacterium pseudolongum subsp. globosum]|uniref:DEAD/DEAH box helicase n=1 Tax=Bifidobacterium pseudolongum TaxID=1694 RepID=UPI00101FE385|nr:DEAD/DEAH box helicase [Bifidobacterium pseudolongum]RYQ32975.1 SNF2- related helicase [Bifidobacterium pseudolongum subsp. globosum]
MVTHEGTEEQQYAVGMRVIIRGQEWLITKAEQYSFGYEAQEQNRIRADFTEHKRYALTCVGIDPLVRDYQATFLTDLEQDIEQVDPSRTRFVLDTSAQARESHLYIESMLRSTVPTDEKIHVAEGAAMDNLPYQFEPAKQALEQPRQRILIADAVGLGKTLEAGILMSELIRRGKGGRILVITSKNMMAQFQREMWDHFTIPLTNLDSSRIQRIRTEIPANANPFNYYDKVIISIDTLKRDIEYGAALDNSYWDIIVIDEAQNVANRANGGRQAQRTRLANRLAKRSDSLIMLSATPHDGSARSFASLMNMLDPTTLPNPDEYHKDDIRQLYIRRFKKDVAGDVSGHFPPPRIVEEDVRATCEEEAAFDCLTHMTLTAQMHDHTRRSMLFRTTLEKSLFSSPSACIKTIDERIKRLESRAGKANDEVKLANIEHDITELKELRALVKKIIPERFARYQKLLQLLTSKEYGWKRAKDDRIVIFTERIETKNFLVEHLKADLNLNDRQIIGMDGSMSDLEQQELVADFNDPKKPVRILVASDVASEGLNLHHLAHRLIHLDTPWSLMVFQQRNGRIDRYGQGEKPDIRFMRIGSENPRIKGDERILQVLINKEKQARDNIGDPAILMNAYDVNDETLVTAQAMEDGESAEHFAARLDGNVKESRIDIDVDDDDDGEFDPFAFIQQLNAEEGSEGQHGDDNAFAESPYQQFNERSLQLMDDLQFVDAGLHAPRISAHAGITDFRELSDTSGFALEFSKDSQLYRWLVRRTPNPEVLHDHTASWSTDVDYVRAQSQGLMAQLSDERWSNTQFLWALSPISEWVKMKSSSALYKRNEAPIIGVTNGTISPSETIVLLTGSIANNRAIPIINEWAGLRYRDGAFVEFMTIEDVWKATGYRGERDVNGIRRYINTVQDDDLTEHQVATASAVLPDAIRRMTAQLNKDKQSYSERAAQHIDEQLDRINQWQQESRLLTGKRTDRETDQIFNDYGQWVRDSYTATGKPVIRVAAAFTGVAGAQR